jgi:hypothetical protein
MKMPMNQQEELLEQVLVEFNVLVQEHGFAQPSISKEKWITRVSYLHINIGIELELDWRDFDVFTLVVCLKNGALPSGYYIDNGKKCRKHLANICTEQRWIKRDPTSSLNEIRTEADFKLAINSSKKMVIEHLSGLFEKGELLFV